MTDPVPSKDLSSLLVDTAQLLDGWKQTSPQDWSEWDQTVRDRLSQQLALLEASKRVTATDLAKTVDAPRPVWSEALQDDIYYASDIDPYIERLRTTLTGISTCSTCEACRGAALRALGEQPTMSYEEFFRRVRESGWNPSPDELSKLLAAQKEREAGNGVLIPFTHWSKDPLVPYAGCQCQTCAYASGELRLTTTGSTTPPGAEQ